MKFSKFILTLLVIKLTALPNTLIANDTTLTLHFKFSFTKNHFEYKIKNTEGKVVMVKNKNEPNGIKEFQHIVKLRNGKLTQPIGFEIIRSNKIAFFNTYHYQYLPIQYLNNYSYILIIEQFVRRKIIAFEVRYYTEPFEIINYD